MGERAERALDPVEPARQRAHDHARERQEHQQRRNVAQQQVLDHVRGEEIVLAQSIERRDQCDQDQHDRGDERGKVPPARSSPGGRAIGSPPDLQVAPHVEPDVHGDREQDRRREGPVVVGIRHGGAAIVAVRLYPVTRSE
jgi:hypothetical protein